MTPAPHGAKTPARVDLGSYRQNTQVQDYLTAWADAHLKVGDKDWDIVEGMIELLQETLPPPSEAFKAAVENLATGNLTAGGPFVEGHVYRIRTLRDGDRLEREHVLTYLGGDQWNARPYAGTQQVDVRSITGAEDLGPSGGRDDQRHRMNKVIRPGTARTKLG